MMIDRNLLTPQAIAQMSTMKPFNGLLNKFTYTQVSHASFVNTIMKLYALGAHFRHIGFNAIYHQGIDCTVVSTIDFLASHANVNDVHQLLRLYTTNGYTRTVSNAVRMYLSVSTKQPHTPPIFHPVPIFNLPPPIDQRTIIQDPNTTASPVLILPRPPFPWLNSHERDFSYHIPNHVQLKMANGKVFHVTDGVLNISASLQQQHEGGNNEYDNEYPTSNEHDNEHPTTKEHDCDNNTNKMNISTSNFSKFSSPKVETVTSDVDCKLSPTPSAISLFNPKESNINSILAEQGETFDDGSQHSASTHKFHNQSTEEDMQGHTTDTDGEWFGYKKKGRKKKYVKGMRIKNVKERRKRLNSKTRNKDKIYNTFMREGLRECAQKGKTFFDPLYDKPHSGHPTWPVSPLQQWTHDQNVRRIMNTKSFKEGTTDANFPEQFRHDPIPHNVTSSGNHDISPLHTSQKHRNNNSNDPEDPYDSHSSESSKSSSSDSNDNGNQSIVNSAVTVMSELVNQVKHLRDGTTEKTKVKQRPTLPTKIFWDGKIDSFHRFSSSFEGHYSQSGCRYIFNKEFQTAYLEFGLSAIDHLGSDVLPDLTKAQLRNDITSIYGALWTSCIAHEVGYSQILKYSDTSDGLRAWIDLKTAFDNKDIRTVQLDAILNTPWTSKSRIRLSDWLTTFDSAFNELEHVYHDMRYGTDAAKRRQLLLQLRDNTDLEWLDYTAKFESYQDLRTGLYKLAIKREDSHKQRVRMRMAHSHITPDQLGTSLAHLLDSTSDIPDTSLARLTRVEDELWQRLPLDVRRVIQEAQRNEMRKRYKESNTQKIGHQYNSNQSETNTPDKANDDKPDPQSNVNVRHLIASINTSTLEEQAALDEYLETFIDSESDNDNFSNSVIRMAITSLRSIYLTNTSFALIANSEVTPQPLIAIIDSGADTCILGKGWYIQYVHPHRKVNVFGFDENLPGRKKLPVVSAISAIDLPNGEVLLLRVHEGIHNSESENTLLSTMQLRDYCHELNDVPRIQGGKQVIKPTEDTTIPLQLHNAMIVFKFRLPTDDEIAFGNILDITSPKPWQPSKYNDIEPNTTFDHSDDDDAQTRINHSVINEDTAVRGDNIPNLNQSHPDDFPSQIACNINQQPSLDELPPLTVQYGDTSTLDNDISHDFPLESTFEDTTNQQEQSSDISARFSSVSTVSKSDESRWNHFQSATRSTCHRSSPIIYNIINTILWELPSDAKAIFIPRKMINPITKEIHEHVFWSRTHKLSDINIYPLKPKHCITKDDDSISSSSSSSSSDNLDNNQLFDHKQYIKSNTTGMSNTTHPNLHKPTETTKNAQQNPTYNQYTSPQPLDSRVPGQYVQFYFHTDDKHIYFSSTDKDDDMPTTIHHLDYPSPIYFDSYINNSVTVHPDDPRSTPDDPNELSYDINRLHRAAPQKYNYQKLAPHFLYRPDRVIRETLRQTTQLAVLIIRQPLRRHIRARFPLLHNRINEAQATDTYHMPVRSLEGYICSQVFVGTTSHQKFVYGMRTESEFPNIYRDHLRTRGIPHTLRRDNAKAQDSKEVSQIHRELIIKDEFSEPYNQQQNPAENLGVKSLKERGTILMDRTNTPDHLWFLCHQYICYVDNNLAHPALNYRIPNQVAGGDRPDISEILCFYWMQPVLALDIESKDPKTREEPGYFVGFEENTGDALTFKIILTDMRTVIPRSVVRPAEDMKRRNKRVRFDSQTDDILATHDTPLPETHKNKIKSTTNDLDSLSDEDHPISTRTRSQSKNNTVVEHIEGSLNDDERYRISDTVHPSSSLLDTQELYINDPTRLDNNTITELEGSLDDNDIFPSTHANKSKTNQDNFNIPAFGRIIFTFLLFTFGLWIPGTCEPLHVPEREHFQKTFDELITHGNQDTHIQLQYMQMVDRESDNEDKWKNSGLIDDTLWNVDNILRHKITKDGVMLKCTFKGQQQDTQWVHMSALTLQDPIPILKYIQRNHLHNQREFKSLTKFCMSNASSRLAKIYKAKTQPGQKKIKFGIEVPLGVKHAMKLDMLNGNTLWLDAIKKELSQLNEFHTFKVLKEGEKPPSGYQQIPYHIVFDVKFDLRRKARLVAGGNVTQLAREDIYSGVVGLETVRLGMFLAELNCLSCCAADIGNAYLNGTTKEKVYIIAGPEFGPLQGRILIIVRALYGLRTSAAVFWAHLSVTLQQLGYKQSKADPNLWFRLHDGRYEYLATYVDDVMAWSKDPIEVINALKEQYTLKGVGIPEYYLGGNVEYLDEHWTKDGINIAFSARTYINNVIPKFEKLIGKEFKNVKTPMAENCHPELDDSPLLSSNDSALYRSITGSLNWIVTLGRFDVQYATSVLSRFNSCPREKHLQMAVRVLTYLKTFPKGRILFDTTYMDHTKRDIQTHDWSQVYPDAEEELPPDMPTPIGKTVRITAYVDADHAHDQVTRRSVTGILIFLNNTLIKSISKRQKTVETSTYGSELVAARIATEAIMDLRYQLRMLGVPLDKPALMIGDNMSVVLNTTVPSSVLKKKHLALGYHRVREAIAAKVLEFAHIESTKNIADVCTKPLGVEAFHNLVSPVLFRKPPHLEL